MRRVLTLILDMAADGPRVVGSPPVFISPDRVIAVSVVVKVVAVGNCDHRARGNGAGGGRGIAVRVVLDGVVSEVEVKAHVVGVFNVNAILDVPGDRVPVEVAVESAIGVIDVDPVSSVIGDDVVIDLHTEVVG